MSKKGSLRASRVWVVVNPASANGTTERRFHQLEPRLMSLYPDLTVRFTTGPGHATALAEEACREGASLLFCCGGDGTLNEVVCGLMKENRRPVLGVIPSGTGCDFRRTAGVPIDNDRLLTYLASSKSSPVDVGQIWFKRKGRDAHRYFLNIASCGLSGLVDHFVNTTTKALGGRVSFLWGTLRGLVRYQNASLLVNVDGREVYRGPVVLVAVANGRYFGGGMMIAPKAQLADGVFDVVTIGNLTKARLLSLAGRIYGGRHLGVEGVVAARASEVEIAPLDSKRVLLDIDGEQDGCLPAKFSVIPGGLRLLQG